MNLLTKYLLAAMFGATAIMLLFYFADRGVLATAARYADDEPELVNFMLDMGYPKMGDWCGEFAASIIKRAGGIPPSGAAIATNWRRYGTPDAMPHVGDVAVADRGVPTGEIGSHVGFVTSVDLENDAFTLESGNASSIYTRRKISCFSFHTPPDNVLSALNGNGSPFRTAIGTVLTGLPLIRASLAVYPFAPATSWANPNDCSQRGVDTDNDDELQVQASANSLDGARVCVLHLSSSDARRFCPYARMARESITYRPYSGCTATTTKGKQCIAWRLRQSACLI